VKADHKVKTELLSLAVTKQLVQVLIAVLVVVAVVVIGGDDDKGDNDAEYRLWI
jgi:hypothetical protein